jgi:ABC-2 type transport system permease protein
MSTGSNSVPESTLGAQVAVAAPPTPTRPLYWSVQREIWENRSIYLAPLAVAGIYLFGFLISTFHLARRMHAAMALDPEKQRHAVHMPYHMAAALVFATFFLVAVFYCLDALYGERRDRSILFWKSLPVSDVTTVLSKMAVPLVILPGVAFAIIVVTHLIILMLSTIVLMGNGPSLALLWGNLPLLKIWVALLYTLTAGALWLAPIYAWLLLVSAWARRMTILWAVLPPVAVGIVERVAFNTHHFANFIGYRLYGWFLNGYLPQVKGSAPADPLTQLTPVKFLCTPGLWLGLIAAVILLAVAMRLRRYREPI